jgi:hypothetical protein
LDVQPAARQVHFPPAQVEHLAQPHPGEGEHGEHRAAVDVTAALGCLAVQLPGCVQQRLDVRLEALGEKVSKRVQ